ncbi:unnamed protein product [Cunninghamella echinulata]
MELKKSFINIFQLIFVSYICTVLADEHNHKYVQDEGVVVWMNTVGPIENKQETYPYFQLPFCTGDRQVEHYHETLGEELQGMDLSNSGISISFLQPVDHQPICKKVLDNTDKGALELALSRDYWFTMFIDDLPISSPLGKSYKTHSEKGYNPTLSLYLHKNFIFEYNGDRIISVVLEPDNPFDIVANGSDEVEFTYSVTWKPTNVPFEKRFEKLLETSFFEHKVHWLSICSSFMIVLFLTGIVSVILLRTVKRDFSRYDREVESIDDFDRDLGDEGYGWKQVHGDVFRQPPHIMFMSAFLGTGSQLTIMAALIILYIIFGQSYVERASITTASLVLYILTSIVAGYTSAKFYATYGGRDWVRNTLLTALLLPCGAGLIGGYINSLAIYYSSSRAVPFTALLSVMLLWLFLVLPLTVFGAILARHFGVNTTSSFPCRINPIPRPIPEKLWYQEPLAIVAMGGILPFGSIFIEMYFIFTSFWTYKIYYVYGFMLLVFMILLVVCACVSIVTTYFLLNSEDHRWHWVSFMSCASTAIYVYLYATYYFFTKTMMSGTFQTSFYFGYTALLCMGMFNMLGFVGYTAGNWFVKKIYQNVKID